MLSLGVGFAIALGVDAIGTTTAATPAETVAASDTAAGAPSVSPAEPVAAADTPSVPPMAAAPEAPNATPVASDAGLPVPSAPAPSDTGPPVASGPAGLPAAAEGDEARAQGRRRTRAERRSGRGRAAREPQDPGSALPGAFGTLALTTRPPGLEVFYGAQRLGRTPLQRRLPVGTHSLRVVSPSGDAHRVSVVIEPLATSVVSVDITE